MGQTATSSETGHEPKYYRLTKKEAAQLDNARASWNRLAAAIGGILRAAGEPAS
jgi:hypothetical protein